MMWFLGSIVIFVCIAVVMIFTGLVILFFTSSFVSRIATLQVSATNLALSAFLGTAFWIFLSGMLSYSGFTFYQARPWLFLLLAGLVATLVFLWLTKRISRPVAPVLFWILVAGFLVGSVSLLPLALKNTFRLVMDPFTYVSIADFLQTHNFSSPIQNNISFPAYSQAFIYQQAGFRMGANFFLALITSWMFPMRSVYVYPGVLAWGLALNVFGLFLWMRWGLKSTYLISILPLFFLAITPNPVQSSAAWGFFPQTLATAFLLFSLSLLSKVLSQANFSIKTAFMWGISWAAMVSIYSELFPVVGLMSLVSVAFSFKRFSKKGKLQDFFKTIFVAFVSGLICANYEMLRMIKALPIQITSVVGWPIHLNFFNLWSDAVGAKPVDVDWTTGLQILAIGLSILWIWGTLMLVKKKQVIPLSVFGIWLAMVSYFVLTKDTNPFRAAWSIYKITQWSSLSLVATAFFALRYLKVFNPKLLVTAAILVCVLGLMPLVSIFNFHGESMREAAGTENPVEDYFQLAQIIKAYKKTNVYQVSPSAQWPRILPSYFLMDKPFLLGDWDGEPGSGSSQVQPLKNSETLFYCLACPFPNSRNVILPANSTIIQQPVISDISKSDFYKQRQKMVFQVGETEKVCLTVFSIRSGITEVWLQSDPALLQMSNDQTWNIEIQVEDGNSKPKIEFPTQKGYNYLCIQSNQATTITIADLSLVP